MAMRILLSAALSSTAMFVWGFVFWGPVLNQTSNLMTALPGDVELDVVAPMRAAQTPDGMYVYPGPIKNANDQAANQEWDAKLADGPIIHMAYHRGGTTPMDAAMFAKGWALDFVIALAAAYALALVSHALPHYAGRAGLLVLVSLIAAIWTNGENVVWRFHTPQYFAGQVIYTFVDGALMALITAGIVRDRSASAKE